MKRIIDRLHRSRLLQTIFPSTISCLRMALKDCTSVLDLGCGPSSPLRYCHNIDDSLGVEIYAPYLTKTKKAKIHKRYLKRDILDLDFPKRSFDAVIMISVLEHLPKREAKTLIKKAESWAKKKVIITTPNGFWPQKEADGNKKQKHLSGFVVAEFVKLGYRVNGLAGLRILRIPIENPSIENNFLCSIRFRPKLLFFTLAALSQVVVYHWPNLAFEFIATKVVVNKNDN